MHWKTRQRLVTWALGTLTIGFLLYQWLPILTLALLSFSGPTGGTTFPMNGVSLHWYRELWAASFIGDFKPPLWRSFLLALACSGVTCVLSVASAQAMRQNQVDSLKPALEPGWVFGYGVAVLADPKATGTPLPAGCWCWGGAYGTDFVVDQKNGISLVLMTNTAPGPGWTLAVDIRRAVYQ